MIPSNSYVQHVRIGQTRHMNEITLMQEKRQCDDIILNIRFKRLIMSLNKINADATNSIYEDDLITFQTDID